MTQADHTSNQSQSRPAAELNEQGLPAHYRYQPDWEITPRQVEAMRQAGEDFLLIDCRTPSEHAHCHIDGATLIPLQQVQQHAESLLAQRHRPTVVYCHHGGRSLRMTAMLRQAGFQNVRSMAGGIDLWALDIDASLPRY